DIKIEVTKVQTDTEQKLAEVELIKKNLEEVTKQLSQLEEQIRKAGDVKRLLAQVDELTKQKKAAEAAIANNQQQLALADQRISNAKEELARLQEVEKRQRAGTIEPGFTAKVAQPYADQGFVVLSKGNLGGVFANAVLDVKRGNAVVAKLKVRDVEQAMSVADLVPGSLAAGDAIRSGDLVVAAPLPAAPSPVTPSVAPSAAPAPVAPAPPVDPMGGGMAAPTMAPAAADPFAPAPAAGGMAPAAPPAAADPFAPPAGGMAPAPAGGTPAAPSTADPFAPTAPK
ncbi:MAG: hypothetical protein ACOYMN_21685, partial [Roseimicrobium sp.]